MKIKILGGGCPKCERLEALAREAVAELGLAADFEKVKDLSEIMAYDVMTTPALVINDSVKCFGRIPSLEEIKTWLQSTD